MRQLLQFASVWYQSIVAPSVSQLAHRAAIDLCGRGQLGQSADYTATYYAAAFVLSGSHTLADQIQSWRIRSALISLASDNLAPIGVDSESAARLFNRAVVRVAQRESAPVSLRYFWLAITTL